MSTPSGVPDDVRIEALADRIATVRAAAPRPRVVIGIAGAPGSGKTTLAEALVSRLAGRPDWRDSAVAHVPMDGFHLADVELDRLGRRGRKGAPDTFDPLGYAALLQRIREGHEVWAPGFERTLEQPIAQAVPVTLAARTVVGEGNYLLLPDGHWPQVRAQFDEVWFCRVDPDVRRERLVRRHVQFGKTPDEARDWVQRIDEPNAVLIDATSGSADLVVDL